jgi:hypothetical protein
MYDTIVDLDEVMKLIIVYLCIRYSSIETKEVARGH